MAGNSENKDRIKQWLLTRRYGIMGTVIFHLLLAILLLSLEISKLQIPATLEVVVAIPPQEVLEKKIEEKIKQAEILRKSSEEEVNRMLRSIVTNENVKRPTRQKSAENIQKYIDQVAEELKNGASSDPGRYKPQKDKHFKDDSLQYARNKKEQLLDSLKSVRYVGESSVSYNLKDRFGRNLPIPVFKCEFGGKVVVAVVVNQRGVVQKAEIVEALSKNDECLRDVAVDAALRSTFNEKLDAPAQQQGTITYNFVKQ